MSFAALRRVLFDRSLPVASFFFPPLPANLFPRVSVARENIRRCLSVRVKSASVGPPNVLRCSFLIGSLVLRSNSSFSPRVTFTFSKASFPPLLFPFRLLFFFSRASSFSMASEEKAAGASEHRYFCIERFPFSCLLLLSSSLSLFLFQLCRLTRLHSVLQRREVKGAAAAEERGGWCVPG